MILGRRYAPAPARPALWAGLRGSLHRTCRHSAVARRAPILGGLMEPPSITIQGISHKDQLSQSGLDADRCSGYTHEQYRTSVARVATTLSPTSTVHLSERSRRPVRRAAGNERWYDHPHTPLRADERRGVQKARPAWHPPSRLFRYNERRRINQDPLHSPQRVNGVDLLEMNLYL